MARGRKSPGTVGISPIEGDPQGQRKPSISEAISQRDKGAVVAMSLKTMALHSNAFRYLGERADLPHFARLKAIAIASQYDRDIQDAAMEDPPRLFIIGDPQALPLLSEVEKATVLDAARRARMEPPEPTSWTATFHTKDDKDTLEPGPREITAMSVWNLHLAVLRVGRDLPDGALEWSITAVPGDRASFYDARRDITTDIVVEAV